MKTSSSFEIDTVMFGGSFDPIHLGHLKVIHYIIAKFDIQKFLLLPSKSSPFKVGKYSLSDDERLKCIDLALDDYEDLYGKAERNKIVVDTYEIESKSECSYTADTICYYINDNGVAVPVNFIIGDDILPSLLSWKNIDYLKANVRFIVLRRSDKNDDVENAKGQLIRSGFNIVALDNPLYDYSSTAVKKGNSVLLSERVMKYLGMAK